MDQQDEIKNENVENGSEGAPDAGYIQEPPSHLGPIVGVLTVILILILGGLYLWGSTLIEDGSQQSTDALTSDGSGQIAIPQPPTVESLRNVSESDELDAIERDVNATNLSGLDAELPEIEKELTGNQ